MVEKEKPVRTPPSETAKPAPNPVLVKSRDDKHEVIANDHSSKKAHTSKSDMNEKKGGKKE